MRGLQIRGLRVRLVLAFVLVAAVATATTGALTFREARTEVLRQSQDAVVRQLRNQINQLAPELVYPPSPAELQRFAIDIADTETSRPWRVLATFRELSATSVAVRADSKSW